MDDVVRQIITRRRFLQLPAVTAVVAACSPPRIGSSAPSGAAGPAGWRAGRRAAARRRAGGVTGTINVSYPDEAGLKPKYVEQAAAAVKTQFSGADVKIDLQKIGDDDFYTKLLLALDSGTGPDVFHVGGSLDRRAGRCQLHRAARRLRRASGRTGASTPMRSSSGVTYKGSVWAIPYGLDMRWLYYRKDDLQKAGLAADWQPANVQGILDAATAVKNANEAERPARTRCTPDLPARAARPIMPSSRCCGRTAASSRTRAASGSATARPPRRSWPTTRRRTTASARRRS